ncbi:MAG TPA: Ni/Fe hydrogenase subunit alpha [Bryobacteraceae bacterium]|nr:Ni/Fe hydrogenase subunit alpha [Bryobacteraceae bacterium]HOQ45920.1 Ni/Fe hydrogenase subunit alpha [Bryobacteraceae bacterium]HPU73261.1 Ni/Fe hydrogenase subunit alpha [Bryobacteraceae bacterium]
MPVETTTRRITIDPITRLEGHGKIEIFLDDDGQVERAYFQVPELRGFEKFAQGRPAEDMPQITSRICGVCPTAHHMAATRALDNLYQVTPPPAAQKIRELVFNTFMAEDHALHFYFLGGPDFVVGPQAPAAERNVLGVVARVGVETGKAVISMRRKLRELTTLAAGKTVHPVFGLPGGVAKPLTEADRQRFREVAAEAVDFAQFTLETFEKIVLENSDYGDLITGGVFTHRTHYMGMVDSNNQVNFYQGSLRVVTPEGKEVAKFAPEKYLDYIAEHVEPWSYMKFCYLKQPGWKGFMEGADSGVFAVAPLARLNVTEGMPTPLAQQAYEKYIKTLGKPVHHTLATHWARIIELIYATERMKQLADDPEITDPNVRTIPTATPREGVGVVEAPRGTLIHHYKTDERGLITAANLIVASQNNAARMSMSVEKAAKGLLSGREISEGLLNMVEMAFRAYDPCLGCATHSLPGSMPLSVRVRGRDGETLSMLVRDADGAIRRS